MNIIKNRYNNKEYKKDTEYFVCDKCKSEFEADKEDKYIGEYGLYYVKCPCCGEENLSDDDGIKITLDNLDYPLHFHFNNGIDTDQEHILKIIKDCVKRIIDNNMDFIYVESGNTFIFVHNCSDQEMFHIVVAKNCFSTEIPIE